MCNIFVYLIDNFYLLLELKEETRMASVANSGILTSLSNGATVEGHAVSGPVQYTLLGSKKPPPSFPTMKDSLEEMLVKLSDERHMAERPDDLEVCYSAFKDYFC